MTGPPMIRVTSVSCLLIQLPIFYWLVGRRDPVTTADLWIGFLRQLPLWGVVCATVWLTRTVLPNIAPLAQLAIRAPTGLLAGGAFILVYSPARRVAMDLFSGLRALKNPA